MLTIAWSSLLSIIYLLVSKFYLSWIEIMSLSDSSQLFNVEVALCYDVKSNWVIFFSQVHLSLQGCAKTLWSPNLFMQLQFKIFEEQFLMPLILLETFVFEVRSTTRCSWEYLISSMFDSTSVYLDFLEGLPLFFLCFSSVPSSNF